jgi:signal transduction histidine kinase
VSRRWLVIPAAIALGLVAETGWPPGVDRRLVVTDLAIGWLFLGGGFVVWHSRPADRTGLLLMATGATWFVATYYPPAAFLYCGPLVQLLASDPTGRVVGRSRRLIVGAVYAASAVAAIAPLVGVGIAIGGMNVAVGLVRLVESFRSGRRSDLVTVLGAIVVGLIMIGVGVGRSIGSPIDDVGLVALQLALAAIVLSIVAEVAWRASSPGVLTRIVVDLGGAAEAGTLRDRLARAVGDPSLTLGYAVDGEADRWVDDTGGQVLRPPMTAERSVTPIAVGGRELGFVAHDPAFVGDSRVFGLIASAAGLAISNSATQAEIRRRVAEVAASRERLVHAADAQGRRIESALENGAEARLAGVAELLGRAASVRPGDPQLRAVLDDLEAARHRLLDFARGVYPATLRAGGLAAAIADLAARSPVPVETAVAGTARYGPTVESTLYFVCSEALVNVAKHARATRVRIQLREDADGPVLRVEDDGVGGASAIAGSGLRGLTDRVEALGGQLAIDSRPGGTSVVAIMPRSRATTAMPEGVG